MAHNTISIQAEPQIKTPLFVLHILEIQDDNIMLVLMRKIPTCSMINIPAHKQAQAKH